MVNHTRYTKKQNGGGLFHKGKSSYVLMNVILKTYLDYSFFEKSKMFADENFFKNEIPKNNTEVPKFNKLLEKITPKNKKEETEFNKLLEKIRTRNNKDDQFIKYFFIYCL